MAAEQVGPPNPPPFAWAESWLQNQADARPMHYPLHHQVSNRSLLLPGDVHVSQEFCEVLPPSGGEISLVGCPLVLRSLGRRHYEPLKTAMDRCVTLKALFLPALASAKRVDKLHGFSVQDRHSEGWHSLSFFFCAKLCGQTSESLY